MTRLRDIGVGIGWLSPGPRNSITDVEGVTVGHTTLIRDPDGEFTDTVRTGVTVVRPRPGYVRDRPLFAGSATLNGNGEMTGLEWIRESGLLTTEIALTGTHSVGVVRDALVALDAGNPEFGHAWSMPVVGETSDLSFNSRPGQFVTADDVLLAHAAASVDVAEGSVGGGTGTASHGFKAGIGTASRRLAPDDGGWTVGVLVQANHGSRSDFRVDGVPVGRSERLKHIPLPGRPAADPNLQSAMPPGAGSIIVIVATDAPLLPDQCRRVAARAGLGIGRVGGGINDSSGDIFLAFSTAGRSLPESYRPDIPHLVTVDSVPHQRLDGIFRAVIDGTEEAIVNAMLASTTMVGAGGFLAAGLDAELLRSILRDAGRLW